MWVAEVPLLQRSSTSRRMQFKLMRFINCSLNLKVIYKAENTYTLPQIQANWESAFHFGTSLTLLHSCIPLVIYVCHMRWAFT